MVDIYTFISTPCLESLFMIHGIDEIFGLWKTFNILILIRSTHADDFDETTNNKHPHNVKVQMSSSYSCTYMMMVLQLPPYCQCCEDRYRKFHHEDVVWRIGPFLNFTRHYTTQITYKRMSNMSAEQQSL